MNITNRYLVLRMINDELEASSGNVQALYGSMCQRNGRRGRELSKERVWVVLQKVNEFRGRNERRGPEPVAQVKIVNSMKNKQTIKVTLKYHPNKVIGEKYEVVRLNGAVTVQFDDAANLRGPKKTLRVSDHINEADATSLADVAEVTVVPED